MPKCPICADELDPATGTCRRAHEPVAAIDTPTRGADANPKPSRQNPDWVTIGCAVGFVTLLGIVIVPAVFQARDAARRATSRNNLIQIALALHNYHEGHRVLPPGGVFNARDTPFFGWNVSIMPYVNASPLYNQIDFKVPWNDPKNSDVFRQPYETYQNPSVTQTRDDQGFALTHYAGNKNLLFPNSSMALGDISDGLEHTILAGEIAADFLPYAQPGNWRDLALGINSGRQSFGRPTGDGALVLMANGSVRFLPNNTDANVLRALSTPAGGEEVSDPP